MWFKNLQGFQLKGPFTHTQEALEQALAADRFRPCGPLEVGVQGWHSPLGAEGPLCFAANGCFLVCLRREDKILPASVVTDLLNERVEQIEAEEIRSVSRREKKQLKDDIYHELLPKAFTRSSLMHGYVDPVAGRLLVDAASPKKAEDLVSRLRKSLGSLPARPLAVQHAPADIMTRWLEGQERAAGFTLADQCELRDPDEAGGIVRCRRQDLGGAEIQAHLKAGKRAVLLALDWEERVGMLLTDQPSLRRLRFADELVEEAAEAAGDDGAALLDADFTLMTLELRRLVDRVTEVLGGVAEGPS
jgi:recombination associated protein RdgC